MPPELPETQTCPICGASVTPSVRYPAYLCQSCMERATAIDGRPIGFSNLCRNETTGEYYMGYAARYKDDDATYDSHDCLVDGIPCRASEAYMGGIVVIPKVG